MHTNAWVPYTCTSPCLVEVSLCCQVRPYLWVYIRIKCWHMHHEKIFRSLPVFKGFIMQKQPVLEILLGGWVHLRLPLQLITQKRCQSCLEWAEIGPLSLCPSHLLLVTSPDGARIASSTGIDVLLLDDFQLVINDTTHVVRPPRRGESKARHRRGRLIWLISSQLIRWTNWFFSPPKTEYHYSAYFFFFFFLLCRAAASWGSREAERCQVSGATALHYPAHRGAPARQRAGADRTTGGPQLSTPPPGEGLNSSGSSKTLFGNMHYEPHVIYVTVGSTEMFRTCGFSSHKRMVSKGWS